MKKSLWMLFVLMLMLIWTMPSLAWQGRVAGAGDALGLLEDESDLLVHPALIADGKKFNAYGHYRLTYEKTTQWDYTVSAPTYGVQYPYAASGYAWKNEGQLGAAFQLGAGRMGVFFDYSGSRGKYSGEENYAGFGGPDFIRYDLDSKMDNFALKVIYGLPLQAVKLGGEFQIAYRNEEQQTVFTDDDGDVTTNYPWAAENDPAFNLYPYMIPYKSKYWEAQGKVSVGGNIGPAKYAFTLRGGLPFASDNQYDRGDYVYAMEGKVKGFNVAGDFWLRAPVSDRVVLPFVMSAGYKTAKRDGEYDEGGIWTVNYEHEIKDMFVKVGGGVDITPAKGTKVAAGLYYDFLRSTQNAHFRDFYSPAEFYVDDYTDMPKYTEHRLTVKALAEKELSQNVALRGGFSVFYGLAKQDFAYAANDEEGPFLPVDMSSTGSIYGVNASVGATVKLAPVTLEPFFNAGYMKYRTSGDGTISTSPIDAELSRTNWLVGGGLSVKF